MATQIQQLRGTAAELDAFTGNPGVITVDETNKTIRVHDGVTLGGHPVRGGREVATRTELKTVNSASSQVAYLTEKGREGYFVKSAGDYSAEIAADTLEGIYIKANDTDADQGAWVRAGVTAYRPQYFGALGGPTHNATPAINACFALARLEAANASRGGANIQTPIDLSGPYWRLDDTINATDIVAWNLRIIGGALLGHCTGKPMIDLVGSRGWVMRETHFYGDEIDRPSDAYIIARSTVTGACDSIKMDHVASTGWFSRSVGICYAHEGGVHEHCNYANYDHEATNTVFQGYDLFPVTSEFTTAVSGHQSFILNKVSNTTFQMGSSFAVRTITGITNASSAVITFSEPHPYAVGKDIVIIDDTVVGMTEMNGRYMTITAVTSTTVTVAVDSTGFASYVSGGTAIHRNEQPTVYLGRADQFRFETSYIVSWGGAKIQLFGAEGYGGRFIDLDLCLEGSGSDVDVEFNTGGAFTCVYYGFSLDTYSSAANSSIFFNTWSGTGFISLIAPKIRAVTPKKPFAAVINSLNLSSVSMQNADILARSLSAFDYASLISFSGTISDVSNGNVYHRNIATL